MPIIIEEFEVVAEPEGPGRSGTGREEGGAAPAETRAADLQHAIEVWAALARERELRLDDR